MVLLHAPRVAEADVRAGALHAGVDLSGPAARVATGPDKPPRPAEAKVQQASGRRKGS
jgi:hypothetical protein